MTFSILLTEALRRDQNSISNLKAQYKTVVTESVMSSFQDYSRLFQGQDVTGEKFVLDGYKSKIESWKLALETVVIVTNIDSYIITGITEEELHSGTL